MLDLLLSIAREATLLVLVASYGRRLYVVQRNTRSWDGLGRALRLELALYLCFWGWLMVLPWVPLLGHPLVIWLFTLAFLAVTIVVTRRLPAVIDPVAEADSEVAAGV